MKFKQLMAKFVADLYNGDVVVLCVLVVHDYIKDKVHTETQALCCSVHGYCIHEIWCKENNIWVCSYKDCRQLCRMREGESTEDEKCKA